MRTLNIMVLRTRPKSAGPCCDESQTHAQQTSMQLPPASAPSRPPRAQPKLNTAISPAACRSLNPSSCSGIGEKRGERAGSTSNPGLQWHQAVRTTILSCQAAGAQTWKKAVNQTMACQGTEPTMPCSQQGEQVVGQRQELSLRPCAVPALEHNIEGKEAGSRASWRRLGGVQHT